MAIAVVQTGPHLSISAGPYTYSPTTRPTAGNFLAIPYYVYGSQMTPNLSATDNQGNTWTNSGLVFNAAATQTGDKLAVGMLYAKNIVMPNAGNIVITISGINLLQADFIELSGVDTSVPIRDSATGSTAATTSSYTITQTNGSTVAGDAVIAVLVDDLISGANAGITTPSGYTQIGAQQNADNFICGQSSYKLNATAGNQSATWNYLSTIEPVGAAIFSLKPASSSSKVHALVEPAFAGLSNLKASIWNAPTGTDIHGSNIGQYINLSSNSSLDGNGNATIDISVGSSFPVATGGAVKLLITNGTLTTGIIDGVVQ